VTEEFLYGTRPGDTEDRILKSWKYYALGDGRFIGPELQDPLTKQARTLFNELDEACFKESSPFYRNKDIRKKISALAWRLGLSDRAVDNKLLRLISGIDEFRNGIAELVELMEDAGRRARYEGRKSSIKRVVSKLRSRMQKFMNTYEQMNSLHVLLQSHFIAQRCDTPHHKEVHDEKLTIFYEPLYHHRDKYFEDPSSVNLSNYLKCWEHLTREPYYRQLLTKKYEKQEKIQKRAAKIQELTDELEIYALMEMTK
jgi:hypothetical protein